MRTVILLLGSILLASCAPQWVTQSVCLQAESGMPIILLRDARHASAPERCVMLQLDYGLIISNADTNRVPAYHLFSRKEQRRFRTEDVGCSSRSCPAYPMAALST